MYFSLRWAEERLLCAYSTLFSPTKVKVHGVCKFNSYWFFTFFWLTKGSRNKNETYILSRDLCAHICYGIWLFGPPWEPEGDESIDKPFYFNLPPAWTTDRAQLGRSVCHKLFLVRGKGRKSAEASGNFLRFLGLIYMYDTSKHLSMPLLDNYSP
jgi:hypothetical protein